MPLVSQEELATIKALLGTGTGLRAATIDVGFDAFDFARTGADLVDRAVAYSTPWGDRLVGLGTAWHASASGPDRFTEITDHISRLSAPDLKVFFGYSFLDEMGETPLWNDFNAVDAFVPRIAIEGRGDESRLTVTVPEFEDLGPTIELLGSLRRPDAIPVIDPGDHAIESHPPVARWAEAVTDAVKVIEAGELDKVVLARSVRVDSTEPVQILRVFRQLVRSYPECYNFAWKSFGSVFMGASPELLVRVNDGEFLSNPLAGSAPRGVGEADDRSIGTELMESPKNREEHQLVVDDLRERLTGVVDDLVIPAEPELKRMATVQHLSTRISGVFRGHVLDIIDRVHPTPAVGGVPTADAVAYIDTKEDLDRGWYSGGIGFVTPNGDGAIAIALRCGLVKGSTTDLFTGAGIVGGSEPADEVDETRLKLRPLLDILAAS